MVVCTIEARMTSSRLPGKVLLPAAGKPLLEHMVERLRRSRHVDQIVVATTVNADDEPISELAERLGIGCFRGSEDDVLSRVLGAAQAYDAELIVELTGDCPLIDPPIVDHIVDEFRRGDCDYAANVLEPTYPRGMDVQVFPAAVLAEVATLTDDPADREHVSLYIYEHPERYRRRNIHSARPDAGSLRITVDTPEDLAVVRAVFEALYPQDPTFGFDEIMAFLDAHPEVVALNRDIQQKPVR